MLTAACMSRAKSSRKITPSAWFALGLAGMLKYPGFLSFTFFFGSFKVESA